MDMKFKTIEQEEFVNLVSLNEKEKFKTMKSYPLNSTSILDWPITKPLAIS